MTSLRRPARAADHLPVVTTLTKPLKQHALVECVAALVCRAATTVAEERPALASGIN